MALVHGWNTNSACWNALQHLPTDRALLPLDLPGYGSRHHEASPTTLDELAEELLNGAPDQALWCAWSLGSMVALRAAALAPERILGLILISPTPRFINGPDWDKGIDIGVLQQFSQAVEENPETGLKRFALLMFETCDDARQRGRHFYHQLRQQGSANPQALQAGLHILAQSDLREQIEEVSQPVCLLTGERDSICPPSAAHWLAETAQWPIVQVDDGHAPMLQHAELILSLANQLEAQLSHV